MAEVNTGSIGKEDKDIWYGYGVGQPVQQGQDAHGAPSRASAPTDSADLRLLGGSQTVAAARPENGRAGATSQGVAFDTAVNALVVNAREARGLMLDTERAAKQMFGRNKFFPDSYSTEFHRMAARAQHAASALERAVRTGNPDLIRQQYDHTYKTLVKVLRRFDLLEPQVREDARNLSPILEPIRTFKKVFFAVVKAPADLVQAIGRGGYPLRSRRGFWMLQDEQHGQTRSATTRKALHRVPGATRGILARRSTRSGTTEGRTEGERRGYPPFGRKVGGEIGAGIARATAPAAPSNGSVLDRIDHKISTAAREIAGKAAGSVAGHFGVSLVHPVAGAAAGVKLVANASEGAAFLLAALGTTNMRILQKDLSDLAAIAADVSFRNDIRPVLKGTHLGRVIAGDGGPTVRLAQYITEVEHPIRDLQSTFENLRNWARSKGGAVRECIREAREIIERDYRIVEEAVLNYQGELTSGRRLDRSEQAARRAREILERMRQR